MPRSHSFDTVDPSPEVLRARINAVADLYGAYIGKLVTRLIDKGVITKAEARTDLMALDRELFPNRPGGTDPWVTFLSGKIMQDIRPADEKDDAGDQAD